MLHGKRILLVISGGIAAYKTLELIRRLRDRGAAVTYVDLSTDPAAEAYVRETSAEDLRLPFVVIAMPNGEHVTFNGNRRDLIDQYLPKVAA